MCLSQRTLNILANASPYNSCHSRSPRFPRPPPHAGARHNPPPYLSVKPCSGANVVDAWPLYDHSGRQGWWLLPASGKTGVDVTGKSIDIVNKGRSKAVPSCASYIQADAGCGQSGPVLSSASGADTKWVFTPVNASAPNGRFLYYITMSVSAAAGGGGRRGGGGGGGGGGAGGGGPASGTPPSSLIRRTPMHPTQVRKAANCRVSHIGMSATNCTKKLTELVAASNVTWTQEWLVSCGRLSCCCCLQFAVHRESLLKSWHALAVGARNPRPPHHC